MPVVCCRAIKAQDKAAGKEGGPGPEAGECPSTWHHPLHGLGGAGLPMEQRSCWWLCGALLPTCRALCLLSPASPPDHHDCPHCPLPTMSPEHPREETEPWGGRKRGAAEHSEGALGVAPVLITFPCPQCPSETHWANWDQGTLGLKGLNAGGGDEYHGRIS